MAGYSTKKLMFFAGYSLISIKHDVNRNVHYPAGWSGPPGSFMWEIMYEGKSNLWDAYIKYAVDGEWKIGAYGNIYNNSGAGVKNDSPIVINAQGNHWGCSAGPPAPG